MLQRIALLLALLCLGFLAIDPGALSQEPTAKLTTDDVVKLWSPQLKSASQYGQTGGSPKQSPNVAAYSFRVVGPSFEEMWNHYAVLCGIEQKYAEKKFRLTTDTGPNGSYVLSDGGDGKGGHGLSMFLLKTDTYTVTVTFQSAEDGKAIRGTLSVVVP